MSKKQIVLKSERITLIPMTEEEMRAQIKLEETSEKKQLFTKLLEDGIKEPEDFIWFTSWKILLNESGKGIGDIGFTGPHKKGVVEVIYSMLPEFRGQGYATEALTIISKWALRQKDVFCIMAETAPSNRAGQRVLEKNGFYMYANGITGPRYRIDRKNFFIVLFTFLIGGILGTVAGLYFGNVALGLYIGMGVGFVLGFLKDIAGIRRKKRILNL